MSDRALSSPLGFRPALILLLALAACGADGPADPCQAYQAYDNVIHDAAEWDAFVGSGCTVVRGHLTLLAGSVDLARAPAVEEVTGGVAISLDEPFREVALPRLRSIGGMLLVGGSASQTAVRLPSLASVGQSVSVWNNAALGAVELPALASVGGGWITVFRNTALGAVELPALTDLGALVVDGNLGLTRLSLPALAATGYVSMGNDPALASLSLPALTELRSGAFLGDLPALPEIDLPALRAVGTLPHSVGLTLYKLDSATRVAMPALRSVAGGLDVSGNDALMTLSVPALDAVDWLTVAGNPAYPECQAIALRDHLVASCGLREAMIGGNDAAATCGP